MTTNFPNLLKDMNLHIQEAQQNPRTNAKRSTMRHIRFKLLKAKDKERILKSAREAILLDQDTLWCERK